MTDDLLDVLELLAPLAADVRLAWRWQWRAVPFGRCGRCWWPAHTLGPDGRPWHAFCWGNENPPSWWDAWVRRQVAAGEWRS